jgi:hypothetical protein
MQNQHARIGRALVDHVLKERGAIGGGRVGTKRLLNGKDIVVNRLGHANDNDLATVRGEQVVRQMSGLCVGIVATDRVQDVDLVLQELLRRDFQGRLAFLDESALFAVVRVGELGVGWGLVGRGERRVEIEKGEKGIFDEGILRI